MSKENNNNRPGKADDSFVLGQFERRPEDKEESNLNQKNNKLQESPTMIKIGDHGDQNNNNNPNISQQAQQQSLAHSQITLNASELSSSDEIAKFR